jgi:predicted RecB family endonuclease
MLARDAFHNIVKIALQKDDWGITHDPLTIRFDAVDMQIDLGAERLIAAEKDGEKIAVEVKSLKFPECICHL